MYEEITYNYNLIPGCSRTDPADELLRGPHDPEAIQTRYYATNVRSFIFLMCTEEAIIRIIYLLSATCLAHSGCPRQSWRKCWWRRSRKLNTITLWMPCRGWAACHTRTGSKTLFTPTASLWSQTVTTTRFQSQSTTTRDDRSSRRMVSILSF